MPLSPDLFGAHSVVVLVSFACFWQVPNATMRKGADPDVHVLDTAEGGGFNYPQHLAKEAQGGSDGCLSSSAQSGVLNPCPVAEGGAPVLTRVHCACLALSRAPLLQIDGWPVVARSS